MLQIDLYNIAEKSKGSIKDNSVTSLVFLDRNSYICFSVSPGYDENKLTE